MDTTRAALILCALAAGCAPTRTLLVHPAAHVNRDRRFYLVVRTLKEEEFVADSYQRIASLVFPTVPDASVKLVRLVSPGRDDKIDVTVPDDQPFAIYALFTDPSESWKVLLTPPLNTQFEVTLDGNRVTVHGRGHNLLPHLGGAAKPEIAAPQVAAPALPGAGQ